MGERDSHHAGAGDLHGFVQRALVVLALVALALFLWRVLDVLLLIFGASLVALMLRALADPIARRTRVPQTAALAIAVALVLAAIVLAGWLFGSETAAQLNELLQRLPAAWDALRERLAANEFGAMVLEGVRGASANLGVVALKLTQLTAAVSTFVIELLLVAFGGLYLAGNPDIYRRGLLKLLPAGTRPRVAGALDASAHALRLWLLGQLVTMAAVGALTGLGLWLVGLPVPLALGLLAGLAEFIPYVGPILAALPGLLIALSVAPDAFWQALLVYLVVQQIESNAIVPLVARQVLALPPALAIFSVVALGLVFGPLGLIFAAPLSVLLVVFVGRLYVRETLGAAVTVPGEDTGRGG